MADADCPLERTLDVDAGVIEEARRRQRRRYLTLAALLAVPTLLCLGIWMLFGGAIAGEPGLSSASRFALIGGVPYLGGHPLAYTVAPSLQAGDVGVCVQIEGTATDGGCDRAYPSVHWPLFGDGAFNSSAAASAKGELDYVLGGPSVAAVRVGGLGTFKAHRIKGLPAGDSAVFFYRPPGSHGIVLPPGTSPKQISGLDPHHPRAFVLSAINSAGDPIRSRQSVPSFQLPTIFWEANTTEPANGACRLTGSLPGLSVRWGQAVSRLTADRSVQGSAFLSCIQVWYRLGNASSLQAAVLLDAQDPAGARPAALWDAKPLPGHPGIMQIEPAAFRHTSFTPASLADRERAQRQLAETHAPQSRLIDTGTSRLVPDTLARRIGNTWLLVRYGNSLKQRLALLDALKPTLPAR